MNDDDSDSVIRITREEAKSSHVDDLLQRQRSMQGLPGVGRESQRHWYYQNWFIFGLVGLVGALLAYAIVEPRFSDTLYWQGKVSAVDPDDRVPETVLGAHPPRELRQPMVGSIVLSDEKVYIPAYVGRITGEGGIRPLPLDSIRTGDELGVYLDHDYGVSIARAFVPNPPVQNRPAIGIDLQASQNRGMGLLLFAIVAGCIGLCIGASDGIVCRLPRRALLCSAIGLLVGLAGGLVASVFAHIVYGPLSELALDQYDKGSGVHSAFGFGIQVAGRSLAWAVSGMAMGLGQGVALRSSRLLGYGLVGGVVGGAFGGMLFDPICLAFGTVTSAHQARFVAFVLIGLSVGGAIGVVELLARDVWLRMVRGPLAGKEFLLFKDVMNVGASPRSDLYLFNDADVIEDHAVLRVSANECDIEARDRDHPVVVNQRQVRSARLRHGDSVEIGRTIFQFNQRKRSGS